MSFVHNSPCNINSGQPKITQVSRLSRTDGNAASKQRMWIVCIQTLMLITECVKRFGPYVRLKRNTVYYYWMYSPNNPNIRRPNWKLLFSWLHYVCMESAYSSSRSTFLHLIMKISRENKPWIYYCSTFTQRSPLNEQYFEKIGLLPDHRMSVCFVNLYWRWLA